MSTGVNVLELLSGIRRFVSSYTFNLPSQFFIERVTAAAEVQQALINVYGAQVPEQQCVGQAAVKSHRLHAVVLPCR
jgi:hypothetical protein